MVLMYVNQLKTEYMLLLVCLFRGDLLWLPMMYMLLLVCLFCGDLLWLPMMYMLLLVCLFRGEDWHVLFMIWSHLTCTDMFPVSLSIFTIHAHTYLVIVNIISTPREPWQSVHVRWRRRHGKWCICPTFQLMFYCVFVNDNDGVCT